jgi:alcohol dehydrogenase
VIASHAVVLESPGAEPVLRRVEWDNLVDDEVLIRVAATGICHTDLSCASGVLPSAFPLVLGHEAAGVVVEVGPTVTRFEPGDRVVVSVAHHCGHCRYCESGKPALCLYRGASRQRLTLDGQLLFQGFGTGTFAEHTVLREISLVAVPASVPLEVAAVTGCAVVTGLGAVLNDAQVSAGATVAVFGCGGVGLSAVMGARLVGAARIIAVDPDERRRALALQVGATDAAPPDLEALRTLEPDGVDYGLEASGNPQAMVLALDFAASMGTVVLVGLPSGEVSLPVPVTRFAGLNQRLVGCNMGGLRPNIDFPRYFRLYADGRLPLDMLTSTKVPIEEAARGFALARDGQSPRVLLTTDD